MRRVAMGGATLVALLTMVSPALSRPNRTVVDDRERPSPTPTFGSKVPSAAPTEATPDDKSEPCDRVSVKGSVSDAQASDAETESFERTAERYLKFRELVLERQRLEERLFDKAVSRYVKLKAFTEQVQAEHARAQQSQFDTEVELFLRKRAFTQKLLNKRRTSASNGGSKPQRQTRALDQSGPTPVR